MKIAGYIFSSLIIILTVQPLLSFYKISQKDMCIQRACCYEKNNGRKSENKNKQDDCNKSCNPFMFCSSCCYLIAEQPLLSNVQSNVLCLEYSFINDLFISNYQVECWHPPEVA